jgi:hypothetical protein
MSRQPLVGLGLLIVEVSKWHLFRYTTLGRTPLQRPLPDNIRKTHRRQTSMQPVEIRTRNPSKRAAADPRLRPRGRWDQFLCLRLILYLTCLLSFRSGTPCFLLYSLWTRRPSWANSSSAITKTSYLMPFTETIVTSSKIMRNSKYTL